MRNTNTPRVWLGCLHCYNSGRLVGEWYDAEELYDDDDLGTIEDVHERAGYPAEEECEEVWGLDTDNIPVKGEIGVTGAKKWGERYSEVGDEDWQAYSAWVRDFHNGDDVDDFRDTFEGQYDSFRDYVMSQADDEGLFRGVPEIIERHFDWDSYAEEVEQPYGVIDANSGAYIFSY